VLSRHTCAHRVDELMEVVAELGRGTSRSEKRDARSEKNKTKETDKNVCPT
jgi:hypothetical protein